MIFPKLKNFSDLILKLFPFPHYLRMPGVGMDISDRSLKYVELKNQRGEIELKKYGHNSIEPGIIEAGEIKNKERLEKILKTLKPSFDNSFLAVSLPEEKAFLKVVNLPVVERREIKESLRLQIEEIVPFSSENIIFDFDILSENSHGLKILLSAFPKKIAEDYVDVFRNAGFFPLSFEVESQSIFRSLVGKETEGAVMVIDFGKTRTTFVIGEGGFVKFSSTINVAGGHIDRILAKNLNVDVFEAEEIKRKSISFEGGKNNLLLNVLPVLSVIKDEAVRILDYWRTHGEEGGFKKNEVEKIILCGGDCNIPGLTEYIAYYLKVNTDFGNPWVNINSFENYVPQMERNLALRYSTALGLASRFFKFL